jgi:VanZ family protein
MAIIFIAIYPNKDIPKEAKKVDKLIHFAEFFILTIIIFNVFLHYKLNKLFTTILIAFLIAILSETIQLLTPDRTFNILDLLSDAVGIFIGAITWKLFKH